MFNTIIGAGAVWAGAASHYGSGSDQMMQLRLRNTASHTHERVKVAAVHSNQTTAIDRGIFDYR
jgi:hypothetical protein